MPKGRPKKPPVDCPIKRVYPCRSCWFFRQERCAYDETIKQAVEGASTLLTEEEARRQFPEIFAAYERVSKTPDPVRQGKKEGKWKPQ